MSSTTDKVKGLANEAIGNVKQGELKDAVKDVKGVAGVAAKAKVSSAEVTGEFDAGDLVKALNKAGFHVKVEDKK